MQLRRCLARGRARWTPRECRCGIAARWSAGDDLKRRRVDRYHFVCASCRGVDPAELRDRQHAVHLTAVRNVRNRPLATGMDHRHRAVAQVGEEKVMSRGIKLAGTAPAAVGFSLLVSLLL